jgi:S-adenosylmethionine hydrolase
MKGVMLSIYPDITFIDISHDIPPQDVLAGALDLAAAYRYFPIGTIFLVVVDPGVGTARRAIAVDGGDYRFVAPDNGVLSVALDGITPTNVVELTDRRYARPTISRTFEGRDRFAPAAAWLAKGVNVGALGRAAGPIVRLEIPAPLTTAESVEGEVLRIDRFGNLITNIDERSIEQIVPQASVAIGGRRISGIVSTYGEVPAGELCALFGSSGRLEIAVNGGSAAEVLGVGRGATVHVRRAA